MIGTKSTWMGALLGAALATQASAQVTSAKSTVEVRGRFAPLLQSHHTFAGLADYDRDGHVDIIARDPGGFLMLFPGQSKRDYSSEPRVQIGNGWSSMTFGGLADWDRDGRVDIIVYDPAGLLFVYPGEGTRGYSSQPRVQIGNGWVNYTIAGLADYDRDGFVDIVARDDTSGRLYLYPGEGKRGYSSQPRVEIGNGWSGYTFAGLADYDRDGRVDIVTRDDATGILWLYPGEGTRAYSGQARAQIGQGWNGYTFAGLADYDYDGRVDIVVRHDDDPRARLWLYPGDGTRTFSTQTQVEIGNGW